MLLRYRDSPNRIELLLYALLSFGLWSLIWLKAFHVPPTQDEVTSFFDYIAGTWGRVFMSNLTNNHFLNSLLGKITTSLFGDSMFIFRTPNVLAFPVYAAALWKIGVTFNSLSRWVFGLGLLLCYPLFEYFGLARGYALSFACIVLAFSFLIQFWKRDGFKYSIYAAICVILSISANLALIHFGIAFSLILMAILLDRKKLKSWSILSPLAIILAGLSFATIGFKHKRIIQVYFEHSDGFIHSTMKTVVNMLTYSIDHPLSLGNYYPISWRFSSKYYGCC